MAWSEGLFLLCRRLDVSVVRSGWTRGEHGLDVSGGGGIVLLGQAEVGDAECREACELLVQNHRLCLSRGAARGLVAFHEQRMATEYLLGTHSKRASFRFRPSPIATVPLSANKK